MTGRIAFRFLHAGDFRLGYVPTGLTQISDDLSQQLLQATWLAASQVFDAAIEHQVDFVLLVGRLAEPQFLNGDIGVQAVEFLIGQFERLQSEGIDVCLADETQWPDWCSLPPNVKTVDRDVVTMQTRANQPAASISQGRSIRNRNTQSDTFEVLVSDRDQLNYSVPTGVDYVAAVGGELCGRLSDDNNSAPIWCSGTTQGRHVNSGNQHGCLIVDVDANNSFDARMIETSQTGWFVEPIAVSPSDTTQSIVQRIKQRLSALSDREDRSLLLIDWKLVSDGPIDGRLVSDLACSNALAELQLAGRSNVFSVNISVDETRELSFSTAATDTLIADFIQLAGRSGRLHSGHSELQRLPWLASEFSQPVESLESRVVRHGFELLG